MWTSNVLNTIVGGGKSSASKTLASVRYSSISLHGRGSSGQAILPLDVEDTVTCFCRLVLPTIQCHPMSPVKIISVWQDTEIGAFLLGKN